MWSGLCTSASEAPRLSSTAGNDNFFDDMLAPPTTTTTTTTTTATTATTTNRCADDSDNYTSNQTQTDEEPAKGVKELNVSEDDDWGIDGWETPQASFINPPPPPPQPTVGAPRNPRVVALEAAVLEELQHYILDFADPRATEELNGDMNDAKGFARHVAYYAARPELAQYTIEQEVIDISVCNQGHLFFCFKLRPSTVTGTLSRQSNRCAYFHLITISGPSHGVSSHDVGRSGAAAVFWRWRRPRGCCSSGAMLPRRDSAEQ